MAPLKRPHSRPDDEAGEGSSSVRRNVHKKARVSGNYGDDSDSGSDRMESRRGAYNDAPSMTQHEKNRDADYSHLAFEEEIDALATQKIMERTETLGENRPADNGIIEYVTMGNFMCHPHLHVELGPLINFIIGENGSGKSTILTAITICLGAKASATNRGGALKDYIKSGQESCKIKLALKNIGVDAYQPDTYGSRIIVERTFTRSGSSGFKLMNEAGRVITTKRSDLDELVEYFQMQIDNPMNILTQDAARQFLNQATAAQKYKFFVKGVQLEQMDNDYRCVSEICDAMEGKMGDQVEMLNILKRKKDEADKKQEMVTNQKKVKGDLVRLRDLCAWSQVETEERELDRQRAILQKAEEQLAILRAKAEEKAAEFEQVDLSYKKTLESVQNTVDGLDQYREREAQAKTDFDTAMQSTNRAIQDQRQVGAEIKEAKDKVASFTKQIKIEQGRLDGLSGGGHAKRLDDLEITKGRAKDMRDELDEKEQQTRILENAISVAEEKLSRTVGPVKAKSQQMEDCEGKIRSLRKDNIRQMDGFDPKIPQLLKMIADDRGFREKPVGPIGLHVKLLQPGWSAILERTLGGVLTSFIVTSKADQERLQDIMRRIRLNSSSILIGNHSRIDTANNEPDRQFDTILRVLDIEHDLVKRQLIISQSIEQILLIEDVDEADRILFDGPRPDKVKACLAKHPSKRGHGIRLAWGAGFRTQDPISPGPHQDRPKMKTTTEAQIAEQQGNLEYMRKEYQTLEAERRQAEQGVARSKQALSQHKRACGELKVAIQRAEDAVERLNDEIDKDNVAGGKLEQLKAALAEAEEAAEIHENSYVDVTHDREKYSEASMRVKTVYDEAQADTKAHEFKIHQMKMKLDQKDKARQGILGLKNTAYTAIEQGEAPIVKLLHNVGEQEKQVESFIQGATQVTTTRVPVPPGKTVRDFETEYSALLKYKKDFAKKIGGTDEEIAARARAAGEVYKAAIQQDGDFKELLQRMKKSYFQRIEMWRGFLKHISARMRVNFVYLLSERGFRGKVRLDHKNKLLELNIEPDETVKSAKGRQTKTLSGGEKSFSSICLLLALWEAMGAPLRCLDEFDVFMDQVNRDVSTGLIIQAARRSVGRQYILITPNAIGGNGGKAKLGDDVKIIRLRDPRQKAIDDMMNGTAATNDESD